MAFADSSRSRDRRPFAGCVATAIALPPARVRGLAGRGRTQRAPQRRSLRPSCRRDRSPSGSSSTARGRRSTRSRRATTCRLRSTLQSGAVLPRQRRPARGDAAGRHAGSPVGRHQDPVVGRRPPTSRASAPIRCGRDPTTRGRRRGRGISVAVIDSGINARHNALQRPGAGHARLHRR